MATVRMSDISKSTGYRIEELCGDGRGWQPVAGESSGWTLTGARRALRSHVASVAGEDVADMYRIVRVSDGRLAEKITPSALGFV